jgi:hypothetical protein
MYSFFNGNEQQSQEDSNGKRKTPLLCEEENDDDRQNKSTNKNENDNTVGSFKRRKLNHKFDTSISSKTGTENSRNATTDELLPCSDPNFDVRTVHGRTYIYKFFYNRFDELYNCLESIAFIGSKKVNVDDDDTSIRKDIIVYNKMLQKTKYSTVKGLQYMIERYMKIIKYIDQNIVPIHDQTHREKAICKKTYHLVQMSRRLSSHIVNDSVVHDDDD